MEQEVLHAPNTFLALILDDGLWLLLTQPSRLLFVRLNTIHRGMPMLIDVGVWDLDQVCFDWLAIGRVFWVSFVALAFGSCMSMGLIGWASWIVIPL